jgi:hypothetical protein
MCGRHRDAHKHKQVDDAEVVVGAESVRESSNATLYSSRAARNAQQHASPPLALTALDERLERHPAVRQCAVELPCWLALEEECVQLLVAWCLE